MVVKLQPYPLYDELVTLSKDIAPDAGKLSVMVNSLSKDKLNVIFSLILHHSIKHGEFNENRPVPYQGNLHGSGTGKSGPMFRIKDLPHQLTQIIWLYAEKS
jgi:hypothetical protein